MIRQSDYFGPGFTTFNKKPLYLKEMLSDLCVSFLFIQDLFKIFGIRDFLPSDFIIHWLAKYVCSEEDLETYCSDIIFIICGYDKKQLNEASKTSVKLF